MVGYKSARHLDNATQSSSSATSAMIYAIFVLCLLGSWTQAAQVAQDKDLTEQDLSRLAGIYVKDGNENGQLRFLASGLTSSSSSSSSTLNSALNQYITNKQDMLEQLRPTGTTTSGTTTNSVTGTTSTGTGTSSGLVSTTTGGAIYVNLGNSGSSSSSSSSSSSATNSAINQAIYGSSPIGDLLPQIVGQAVAGRRRPGQVNRRRVPAGNRRRVNKRRGSVNNNQIQRRRRGGNKRGRNKNKAQVMVVRPNRG